MYSVHVPYIIVGYNVGIQTIYLLRCVDLIALSASELQDITAFSHGLMFHNLIVVRHDPVDSSDHAC